MRENRNIAIIYGLLFKTSRFIFKAISSEPRWFFVTTDNENFQLHRIHPYLEAITHTHRKAIRSKVLKQRRLSQFKWLLAISLSLFILRNTIIGTVRYLFSAQTEIATLRAKESLAQTKDLNRYFFFVKDGDRWLEEGHYHNAIFQYKKALVVYPSSDAEFKLAAAYVYHCQYHNRDCEKGLELVQKLQQDFPLDKELANIALVFTHDSGHAMSKNKRRSNKHIIPAEY